MDGQFTLFFWKHFPAGYAKLPFHEIESADHFGYRMLDLQARIHLHEVEVAILGRDELHGTGTNVADCARRRHGRIAHRFPALGAQARCGCLLEYFLVAALH